MSARTKYGRRLVALAIAATASLLPEVARADLAETCATEAERGHDLVEKGRFVEALGVLTRCARDECPRIVRADCRQALVEVRNNAPRIIVRVRTRSGDVLDPHVTIDGVRVPPGERVSGTLVDPGPHTIRVAPLEGGDRPIEQTAIITATDRARTIDIVSGIETAPASALGVTPPDRRPAHAAGALGLSFLTTFAVLGTWSVVEYRSLESSCGAECFRADVEVAHTRAIVADVALGAAVVSLGVATVLWLTAQPSPASTTALRR